MKLYFVSDVAAYIASNRLVHMSALRNHPDENVVPLWNAVLCLDCEVISNSRTGECPSCEGRSLVSLARMLGGSLLAHRAQSQESVSGLFDITITVELQQMYAKELCTTVERLTGVIGPKLAGDQATLHVTVKPTVDKLHLQGSLFFPEREAA